MKKLFYALLTLVTLSPFTPAKAEAGEKIKLVIDAGHGGADKGAVAKDGTSESELNMLFAKELKKVTAENHMQVVMTNNEGENLSLADRAAVAKPEKGVTTYFISFHISQDAAKETSGITIFFDGTNTNAKESERLAQKLVPQLSLLKKTEVEAKGVAVLKQNAVPAIMINPGYITNEIDMQNLIDPGYRWEVANLIVKTLTK